MAKRAARYAQVRAATERLCAPLEIEDYVIQSMPDASPARWHLAHTTWFFETFVLKAHEPGFVAAHPTYEHLFNSYYKGVGTPFPRPRRGTLSRPTVKEIYAWRRGVDERIQALLAADEVDPEVERLIEIGLHHEQQHQELLVTDLKHGLLSNPLLPRYCDPAPAPAEAPVGGWFEVEGGRVEIGHTGEGFHFDNEGPQHSVWIEPCVIARDLITNADWLAFMADGGYDRPALWMDAGWEARQAQGWQAPLYWQQVDGAWHEATLGGLRSVEAAAAHAPVAHVSWFEADAFARWSGARLPTEFEWAHVAQTVGAEARGGLDGGHFHPTGRPDSGPVRHLFGEVWCWTESAYRPFPGYRPLAGTLGEYNGKFMHGQMVLRGSSCATPRDHARLTYRNFFAADKRWQFTGLRLARTRRS